MDTELANQLNMSTEALLHALCVSAFTKAVTLTLSGNHSETISFFVFTSRSRLPLVTAA